MSTSILIVGATGKQGGAAISTLLGLSNSDYDLRFLTRNPTSPAAQKLENQGAKAVKGDLFDKSALGQALAGVERAFLVTDAAAGEEKETQQGKVFIDAAKEAGTRHIVFTSVGGADTATNVPHFRSKYEIEKHLKASGLNYTILRPVAFMDNFPIQSGIARFLGIGIFYSAAGHKAVHLISVKDIGIIAGRALSKPEDPVFRNTTIDLSAGPYGLEDVRKGYQAAQGGGAPWFASYIPTAVRNLFPHDFKEMMIFFDKVGYPAVDVEKLRTIHPGLSSFKDYAAGGK